MNPMKFNLYNFMMMVMMMMMMMMNIHRTLFEVTFVQSVVTSVGELECRRDSRKLMRPCLISQDLCLTLTGRRFCVI